MNNQNPFTTLDSFKEQLDINEAYDRETERLREERIRIAMFVKEREQRIAAERRKKNPGE